MTISNKESATTFLRMCAAGDVAAAYARFVSTGFRHHNAWCPGDAASLQAGMVQSHAQNPNKAFDVKMAIEEGDRVAVLSHVVQKPADRGIAVVHILRFEAGRIAEMWDLGQPIPADSPNENGMF